MLPALCSPGERAGERVFLKGSSVYSFGRIIFSLVFLWLCRCLPHPRWWGWVWVHGHLCGGQRSPLSIFPQHLPTALFVDVETAFLTSLKFTIRQCGWPASPRDLPGFAFLVPRLHMCMLVWGTTLRSSALDVFQSLSYSFVQISYSDVLHFSSPLVCYGSSLSSYTRYGK